MPFQDGSHDAVDDKCEGQAQPHILLLGCHVFLALPKLPFAL